MPCICGINAIRPHDDKSRAHRIGTVKRGFGREIWGKASGIGPGVGGWWRRTAAASDSQVVPLFRGPPENLPSSSFNVFQRGAALGMAIVQTLAAATAPPVTATLEAAAIRRAGRETQP